MIRSLCSLSRALIFGAAAFVLATCLLDGAARAATMTFTSRPTFEASLPAGFYFNDFSTVPNAFNAPVPSVAGSGGTPTIGYTITAPASGLGVFPDLGVTKAIGNWATSNDIVVSFTSGNVVSAGANFWLSDISGTRRPGSITVNFSNGSSGVVPSTTSGAYGFLGITTTDGPLTSMTIVGDDDSFLNFTNFSTAAVPEPATIGMAIIGLLAASRLGGLRRRS
jgi:hypothetical protein